MTIHANETTRDAITRTCAKIRDMLIAKNEAYGDSAIDPVRIFSRADPAEAIRVRIDDKLSRISRGKAAGEDVVLDLIGYLVLLRIASGAPVDATARGCETCAHSDKSIDEDPCRTCSDSILSAWEARS